MQPRQNKKNYIGLTQNANCFVEKFKKMLTYSQVCSAFFALFASHFIVFRKSCCKQNGKTVIALMSLIFLSACGTELAGPVPGDPRFAPTYPEVPRPMPQKNGSIYQEHQNVSLFQDRKARKIGDILTIRLEENTNAQKKADTKNSKKNETNFAAPTLFGHAIPELSFKTSSDQSFDSKGESKQSNNLQGTITVTVSNVLPNGYLAIQGESWVNINRGSEFIRLTGIVRPDDIDADNTVSSQRVANARIGYSGTGQIANSNRAGILSNFFNAYAPY